MARPTRNQQIPGAVRADEKTLADPELADQAIPATTPQDQQHNIVLEEQEAPHGARPQLRRRSTFISHNAAARADYKPFADALRAAMMRSGLSASEVARQIWGTTKDSRNYDVARNRDRIGHYLAGTSYPNAANLEQLARVLGVPVTDLAVNPPRRSDTLAGPKRSADGGLSISATAEAGVFRLQIDRVVPWDLMMMILPLLREAEIAAAPLPEPGTVINGGEDGDNGSEVA